MAGKSRPQAGSVEQPKSGSGNSAPASQEIVVTIAVKDHPCDQCGEELLAGDFQRPINDSRICLSCAKLDALEFLPRGDAAISRRAAKYSAQKIVVVKWSKARNRFERQGILAAPEAIERARAESLADAAARETRRQRNAKVRAAEDRQYVGAMAEQIKRLFPGCPPVEAKQIAGHACAKYSGRVGRSAAAKDFEPAAIRLAVIAHIRHTHSRYDDLLAAGWSREASREKVWPQVERVMLQWQKG